MLYKFIQLIFAAVFFSLAVVCINAQADTADTSTRGGANNKEDLPKGIKEMLARGRIEREKKDYEELLQNGEEAVELSESLEKTFAESNKFSAEDRKKLDRLEKLAKKIRRELGADESDDADDVEKPTSMLNAFKILQTSTGKLVGELKKTSRYSVSVVAIQSSNAFLKIIKFIRFGKN
jgi:K+/H+ antiporter YhaU regulatory subunit KhtT